MKVSANYSLRKKLSRTTTDFPPTFFSKMEAVIGKFIKGHQHKAGKKSTCHKGRTS